MSARSKYSQDWFINKRNIGDSDVGDLVMVNVFTCWRQNDCFGDFFRHVNDFSLV